MKTKYKLQVVQDFILLIILMSLMGFHLWSENIHEWLGIIFLAIILIHNRLNVSWFKKVFDGGHSAFRMMQIAVNIILALFFFTAIASGLMLSRHVVPDLPIHNATDFVRKIHMTSVHWIQIFIAIHLSMHWKMLANFFVKYGVSSRFLFSRPVSCLPCLLASLCMAWLHLFTGICTSIFFGWSILPFSTMKSPKFYFT